MTTDPDERAALGLDDLADILPAGWVVERCPWCQAELELTAINEAFTEIALALHLRGGCVTGWRRYGRDEDLPALPADTRMVRLLDHHGQLIEEISPEVYETMRPGVNVARRARQTEEAA